MDTGPLRGHLFASIIWNDETGHDSYGLLIMLPGQAVAVAFSDREFREDLKNRL